MNKSLRILMAIFAFTATRSISSPGDLLDSPGSGYRQQIERAFPTAPKNPTDTFRVRTHNVRIVRIPPYSHQTQYSPPPAFPPSYDLTRSLSSFLDTLSEPFHFSLDNRLYWPSRNPK